MIPGRRGAPKIIERELKATLLLPKGAWGQNWSVSLASFKAVSYPLHILSLIIFNI